MTVSLQARDYLLPTADSFWRWWEDGQVLGWKHSKTIAFRAELRAILAGLIPSGLPPLGALALLLAATQQDWRKYGSEESTLLELLDRLPDSKQARRLMEDVLDKLGRVAALDPPLRNSVPAKITLAEIVFERSGQRTLPAVASEVVELLEERVDDDQQRLSGSSAGVLLQDLQLLAQGLPRIDAETVANRMRTGLDAPPLGAEDIDLSSRVRSLLGELQDDAELQGLAAVANRLLAAVALPRRVSQPDDLPVGGVSDISNRGSLDRLLLSELAYDNLTLSVRVAMNEALFLRRETPRRVLTHRRAVLLESGIRSWGLPRVYATAVALALAATSGPHDRPSMFRARGASLAPVDLTSRDGLVEHLSALDLDLHPGAAWDLFRRQAALDDSAEPVLITSDAVAEDPAFRRLLTEDPLPSLLVITVGRDGRFELSQRTPRGVKSLRTATLDLEQLLTDPQRQASSLRDRDWLAELPAVFAQQPFPLRMPFEALPTRTWRIGERGTLSVSRDRRLMHWTDDNRGALQISDELPTGRLRWASATVDTRGRTLAVIGGDGGSLHLLDVRLGSSLEVPHCEVRQLETSFRFCNAISLQRGVLLVIGRRQVDAVELPTGRRLGSGEAPPRAQWQRDRFFRREGDWFAAAFDGHGVSFVQVPTGSQTLSSMFDLPGEGPVGLTSDGSLYHTATETVQAVKHRLRGELRLAAVAQDGHRFVLAGDRGQHVEVVTSTGKTKSVLPPASTSLPGGQALRMLPIRSRVTGVGIDNRRRLVLQTRRGAVGIQLQHGLIRLVTCEYEGEVIPMRPLQTAAPIGIRLSRAELPGGGSVILDSRGLLHLKGPDRSVPESTLVLHDHMSGWMAPDQVWGMEYFVGDRETISATQAYESAIRPLLERRR